MNTWICTDDGCQQHVRKLSDTRFELIEIGACPQGTYEVYTDIIETDDYLCDDSRSDEVSSVLSSFGYESIEALQAEYGLEWRQIFAECVFEHYGSFQVEPIAATIDEAEAIRIVHKYIQREVSVQ